MKSTTEESSLLVRDPATSPRTRGHEVNPRSIVFFASSAVLDELTEVGPETGPPDVHGLPVVHFGLLPVKIISWVFMQPLYTVLTTDLLEYPRR